MGVGHITLPPLPPAPFPPPLLQPLLTVEVARHLQVLVCQHLLQAAHLVLGGREGRRRGRGGGGWGWGGAGGGGGGEAE